MLEMTSATAVWYSTGLAAVPIRWVVVRDPQGEFATQALLCTELGAKPEQILRWFALRWQFRKRVGIWGWRPKGSGRIWQYGEPHRCS